MGKAFLAMLTWADKNFRQRHCPEDPDLSRKKGVKGKSLSDLITLENKMIPINYYEVDYLL